MSEKTGSDRRSFLKESAKVLATAGSFSVTSAMGIPAYIRKMPSQTLRLGFIGLKGMGWGNLNAFKKHPESDVVAFADIDSNVLKSRQQEFQKSFNSTPELFTDYRKMLDRKDIDAIVINTPDHWHALQLVHSLEAGKHAYIEKPLANSIEECQYLEKAARKYGKVVQVGQQQRSGKHFQDAIEWLSKGELGRIRSVRCWIFNAGKGTVPKVPNQPVPEGVDYNSWLGPAPERPFNPNRFHFTFRWYWEYAGGLMTDWGVHLLDIALWGMNSPWPISVSATGGKFAYPDDDMQTPDTLTATYEFQNFMLTWEHTIGIGRGPHNREHGIAFYGENGVLLVDRKGWEVEPEFKKTSNGLRQYSIPPVPFQSAQGDDRFTHTGNFIRAIFQGEKLACPISTGSQSAIVAHLGNIAFRSGNRIQWDSTKNAIKGSTDAQKFAGPVYRKPFFLPSL
jgi:predicted dehydrogenase